MFAGDADGRFAMVKKVCQAGKRASPFIRSEGGCDSGLISGDRGRRRKGRLRRRIQIFLGKDTSLGSVLGLGRKKTCELIARSSECSRRCGVSPLHLLNARR
eukprot:IDg16191t1